MIGLLVSKDDELEESEVVLVEVLFKVLLENRPAASTLLTSDKTAL